MQHTFFYQYTEPEEQVTLCHIIRCKLLGRGVGESLTTQDILKGTVDAFKSDGKNKKQQQQTEAVY